MKHIVQIQVSGTRDGIEWPAVGQHIDLSPDEAAHLVANGTVAPVPPASSPPAGRAAPETATAPKPETRAARRKT